MRIRQIILSLLTLFAINMYSQERIGTENCFGERVIQDYLSCFGDWPEMHRDSHLMFADSDTRQMAASFLNTYADSTTTDTIFFILVRNLWFTRSNMINIIPGDTLFHAELKGRGTFEAFRTPFLNMYGKTYWEDLCTWDKAHISEPSKDIILDGCYYYITRLIYHKGQLQSADFCGNGNKLEYEPEWFDPDKLDTLPYPKDKQWPNLL